MFSPTKPAPHAPPLTARAAVETVRIGSAGLSASYYAMLGLAVHPLAAVGLGLVAGAADYVKGNALSAAIDGPGFWRRAVAVPLFVVLFVASMIAVDGVLLTLRGKLTAGPADVIGAHERATADHAAAVAELAKLAGVRSPDAIRAAMDGAPVKRSVFRGTNECTDITKDSSLEACRPLTDLRKEMADAIRKRELEAVRDKAAARLDALGPRPAAADPQARILAGAAGVSEDLAAWVLVAIVGFAIEFAACFGMYVLAGPRRPSATSTAQSSFPAPGAGERALAASFATGGHPMPPRPRGTRKPRRPPASNVVAFPHPVIGALEKSGGTVASNQELAQLMGVTEGESTKRVAEVAHLLTLRREGKRIVISLREAAVA
ncbi:MAG: hypothetical protein B7Y80_01620 [Hyphomicrobium sp. 32-62-53]|nr:MAG: hypothetical protein B7Z29_01970 [Hyphomicrobium sp. 12-62-95]OYY01453.1 MAG: hypothetical protein B7Y80_01620 [Hyphomicrobium sp. 32-62-53]